MRQGTQTANILRFDSYELDLATEELRRDGLPVKLPPQPFKVLAYLVSHAGEMVTRQELREHLWAGDTFVDFDLAINQAIKQIRAVLDDDPENPRYVATMPRRGYRFIAPVTHPDTQQPVNPAPTLPAPVEAELRNRPRKGLRVALLAAGAILLVTIAGYLISRNMRVSSGKKAVIAVLPFQNLSGDPKQEFFSDGMTEEMIAQLGALDPAHLAVIARTSSFKYAHTNKGVDEIGKELGVDYVVEGSIREADGKARITAQLIQVKDQTHLWSQSFDRDLTGILSLQREVAEAIARQIDIHVGVPSAPPVYVNWEAYSAYLKGRHMLLDQKTPDSIRLAARYFQQAIDIDPKFALAYAGLADAYVEQSDSDLSGTQAFALAKKAAAEALSIDPSLAEAHVSMANLLLYNDWKFQEAEQEYKRAIELKPTYEEAHHSYSHYLMAVGHHGEAIAESRRVLELDPLSSHMNAHMGLAYLRAGMMDEALAQLQKTVQLDPTYIRGYEFLGLAYREKQMYPEAIEALKKAVSLQGKSYEGLPDLACALIEDGDRAEGLKILRSLEERSRKEFISPADLAMIYVALGDNQRALDLLEEARRQRSPALINHLKAGVEFRKLHADPRFQKLVREVGFPDS